MNRPSRRPAASQRRIAGSRRTNQKVVAAEQPAKAPWIKRPAAWLSTTIIAGAAAIIGAAMTSLPDQLLDSQALGDTVRNGSDIRITAELVQDRAIFDTATPHAFRFPAEAPLLRDLSVESASAATNEMRLAGGSAVGHLQVRLILEGRRNQQIRITNIRIVDVRSTTAHAGTLLLLRTEGEDEAGQLAYDLGEPLPIARTLGELQQPVGDPYFESKTISLADREQVALNLTFEPKANTLSEFRLQVLYTLGDGRRNLTVDDNGTPFRVTALNCIEKERAAYESVYALLPREDNTGNAVQAVLDPLNTPFGNLYRDCAQ